MVSSMFYCSFLSRRVRSVCAVGSRTVCLEVMQWSWFPVHVGHPSQCVVYELAPSFSDHSLSRTEVRETNVGFSIKTKNRVTELAVELADLDRWLSTWEVRLAEGSVMRLAQHERIVLDLHDPQIVSEVEFGCGRSSRSLCTYPNGLTKTNLAKAIWSGPRWRDMYARTPPSAFKGEQGGPQMKTVSRDVFINATSWSTSSPRFQLLGCP